MKAVKEVERLQGLSAEYWEEIERLKVEIETLQAVKPEQPKKPESKKAGE